MRAFYRMLRILSAVTLFFFSWSYMPLFQIAAWAAEQPSTRGKGRGNQGTANPTQSPLGKGGSRGVGATSGERFEKALEDIRENVGKAEKKHERGEDDKAERENIRAKRAEIESADSEFKKEFAATEKKLKDAKLPQEILDRHYKFVKHYEDNLKELKTNLDDVDKAKTKAERKVKFAKAKAHLEKTRTPSKHVPLDPNKLPHRMVKGKERAPRLKKEEFERDFPRQKKPAGLRSAEFTPLHSPLGKGGHGGWDKPILLAYNSTIASDMPLELPRPARGEGWGEGRLTQLNTALPDFVFSGSNPQSEIRNPQLILAQVTVALPTPDDLGETPEVQFTPEIQAKAAELGYNPVKIYEWVRNNIEFVPTYGSIQGADMCLQTKQCNAFDAASLLIGLLRSSSIPARYTVNTVEIPIGTVMNWVGNFSDPKAALTFIASGGIPVAAKMSGGQIVAARMEMIAVEAYVAYGPYSGRLSNLNPDKIWVPLDPSFKQYTYTEGIDLQAAVPFDGQTFANQVQSTATINETEGYVTGVDSNYIQTTTTNYQTQIQNYISQNMPNASVGDIIGNKEIKKRELGVLPVTLPYKVVTAGVKYSEIPDSLRHKVILEVQDDSIIVENSLSYTINVPEIVGKRVTLSYSPAAVNDEQVISSYDGIFNVPAYLVSMVPRIKVEGVLKITGGSIGLGIQQRFNMRFTSPSQDTDVVANNITVGAYYGIGINPSMISAELLQKRRSKLEAVKSTVSDATIYTDNYIGELLYTTAVAYFYELDVLINVMSKKYKIGDLKHPSEAIVSKDISVATLYGIPTKIADASMMIDVDRLIHSSVSRNGNVDIERQFTMVAGQISSALEHGIFEQMYGAKGISTIQVLQSANNQGIPIFTITPNNIAAVLPMLQLSTEVKMDIQNAVNAGKHVVVPQQNVSYYGWYGTGFIVMDPQTGSGAYLISTNLASGSQCVASGGLALIVLALVVATSDPSEGHGCNLFHIQHLWEEILVFLAAGLTLLTLSFYIGLEAAAVVGIAGTLMAILSSFLLVVAVIFLTLLLIEIRDLITNHAYIPTDQRRSYVAKRIDNMG